MIAFIESSILNLFMMRFIIFLISFGILISCHPYKVYKISGIDLNSIQADTTFRLRSDGLYSAVDIEIDTFEEKFKTITPLIVLNTQKNILINYAYSHDAALHLKHYVVHNFIDYVGDYVIHKDTIWAKIPIILDGRGGIPKIYESYFQGELKNRNTIVHWRMIRPFPKANRNWNDESFRHLTKPHTLCFIESKELLGLDSLYQQQLKASKNIKNSK
jgi:hypothetical protein